MTVLLDDAVTSALSHIRTGSPEHVREDLREALTSTGPVPREAIAYVEAADEHLAYGEVMEARMLLTVAHRLLAPSPLQPAAVQPAVVLPTQVSPPTTPIRV
ncbi:hypothetical protein BBK82_32065 [Lentzea guizhouensis]|uniref:Uncharacterized protein n=1 Tax=Lentzea guizhouensis TaxID=1586287 RepID=A0A1B2HQK1_9PSEU|nr:hypothetical protein [Lentzea guizhouensis]ANZ39993.1 hypothetical protein BBK82_32065 [Lentzea guizhouensis]